MRCTVGELKAKIREDYMRGVPEFAVRDASRRFVAAIGQQIRRHVLMTRGDSTEQREALSIANDVLGELEKAVNDVVEQKLWRFIQQT